MRFPIAKEGLIFILPSLCVSFLCYYLGFPVIGTLVLFLSLFFCYFFRNPHRYTVSSDTELLSPADGHVMDVEEVTESEFIKDTVRHISIFMNVTDVHVNRAPCDGTVERVQHREGAFKVAFKKGIGDQNERNYILIRRNDESFLIVQIAGFVARRIICKVRDRDVVKKGSPVGMIAFGSRVDLYMPISYVPAVIPGQKVKSGITVLARRGGEGE
jgi:phosphatidylserine decarboxylase